MSRIPFWLIIVFALILCAAGSVTLLHRAGFLADPSSPQVVAGQTADASGLLLTGAERRAAGLTLTGRTQPQGKISLMRDGETLAAQIADSNGDFTLAARLYDAKGWVPMQVGADDRPPVPIVVNMTHQSAGKVAVGAMQKQTDGSWTAVTLPEALAISAISELPDGNWRITGQQPQGNSARRLLIQLYSDDRLITTAEPAGPAFALTLPKAARPQRELRLDIYDAASLQPVIRLAAPIPLDRQFFRLSGEVIGQSAPVWIWQDAVAQQSDPAELRVGQIVPVAAPPAVKAD